MKTFKIEKNNRFHFYFNLIIRIILVFTFIVSLWEQNWLNAFLSLLTLVLIFIPFILQRKYKIELPIDIQISIILFICAGIFLGAVKEFYHRFWWWDSLLHFISGIGLGLAGFLILYSLYKGGKLNASYFLIVFFSFCFAVAIGVLWEIFEFVMDYFFGLDMQRARNLEEMYNFFDTRIGVLDTMWDLILDALGALIVSFAGYIYLKKRKVFLLDKLIKKFEKNNPELFNQK